MCAISVQNSQSSVIGAFKPCNGGYVGADGRSACFSSVKEKCIKIKKYILIYWKIYVTVKTVFRWLWWRPDVGRAALAVAVQRKNCTVSPSKKYVDIYISVTVIFILFIWKRYVASPTFWPIGGRVVVHRRVWEREFEFKLKGFGWEKMGW